MSGLRHVVIDVEAVLDTDVPAKEGASPDDEARLVPPVQWRVVALGCFAFVDYQPEELGCIAGAHEVDIIRAYGGYLERERPCVVTWNGRFFDHPVLGFRALKYLVPMPWWYSPRGPRYRYGDKAIDLKDALADFGAAKSASQNQVARLIGWPGKGETSGADVARLHAEGKQREIERYCLGDVVNLAAAWLRFEVLRGNISRAHWRARAQGLLDYLARKPDVADLIAKVDRPLFVEGDTRQLSLIP